MGVNSLSGIRKGIFRLVILIVGLSFTGLMALQLPKNASSVKEWVQKRRESVQPWGEFLNWSKIKAPKAVGPAGTRVVKNIEKFQSNYLFVFVGLFIFCILTSPMLLFAIAGILGACLFINHKSQDRKIVVMGRELSVAQQYSAVGLCSIPLLWIAGAGSVIFWVIGASVFAVLLHAGMYRLEDEAEPFDAEMELPV